MASRVPVYCPVCRTYFDNDDERAYQSFEHFVGHGMGVHTDSGDCACLCGKSPNYFHQLNDHICRDHHDWPTLLALHQLRNMP